MKADILVAGATGNIGQALLMELSGRNMHSRALARDIDKARTLLGDKVELVQGDYADAASLEAALAGVRKAFVATPVHPDSTQWFNNFFAAATNAGTEQIVKLSAYGADQESESEIIRAHGESDRALLDSGKPCTILQPNSFYQNLLWQAEAIRTQGQFYLPTGEHRISCIDVRDIASAAANILAGESHTGRTYKLTGPQALSYPEMAQTLSELSGKTISFVPVPVEASRHAMLEMGLPEWHARVLAEIQYVISNGKHDKVEGDLASLLETPPRTFKQFASDHLPAFR